MNISKNELTVFNCENWTKFYKTRETKMLEILETDTRAQKAGKTIFNDKIHALKLHIKNLQLEKKLVQSDFIDGRADVEPDFDVLLARKNNLLLIECEITHVYAELVDFIEQYVNDFS